MTAGGLMTRAAQITMSDPLVFQNFPFCADHDDFDRYFPAGHAQGLGDHPDQSAAAGNFHNGHGNGVDTGFVDQADQLLDVGVGTLVEFRTGNHQLFTGQEGAVEVPMGKAHTIGGHQQVGTLVMGSGRVNEMQLNGPMGKFRGYAGC